MTRTLVLCSALLVALSTSAFAKTAKECRAEWQANKAANQANHVAEKAYVAKCRAGDAAAPAPSTAKPAPTPARTAPAPTTGGQTEAQVKASCAGDTVVWVNSRSKIYHFAGHRDHGHTKSGQYMCEKAATAAGNRAAKNEKHP